ncbi:Ig-like domain-containing protein [Streptomyces sp. NPDC014983]|uniref:Ig-like domain-containing protein n=1 Tax=Streptomyces sp. NPDC014983 TaxID=3364933 RepID=UPI0036F9CBB4
MRRRRTHGGWAVTAAALAAVLAAAAPAAAAPSATSVTASPATTTVGGSVQLTASVTCASDPSGGLGMSFFDGGDLLSTVPVGAGGQATYTTSFTTTGPHTITAAYNGNQACDASSSTTTVQVSASPAPPPGGTPGLCLLTCGSLIGFVVGDIHNSVSVR